MLYENFQEVADGFVDGESWTHKLSDHPRKACCSWQHGVQEFAAFLDRAGVKISGVSVDQIFDDITTFKPEKFEEWCPRADDEDGS